MKRRECQRGLALALAALVALRIFSGAPVQAEDNQLSPREGAAKMEAFRQEITATRTNIFFTLSQLDQIRHSADPQAQFQRFTNQLAKMEERAAHTRELAQTLKKKGDAYFAGWEARTAAIQDAERRQDAEASRTRRKKSYDRITLYLRKAGADFPPLVDTLKEIRDLLSGKPTQREVSAAKNLFMQANWRCSDVQRSLMEVEIEFELLAADFAENKSAVANGSP